jgi:hypothetical protein
MSREMPVNELLQPLASGLPAVSSYTEFRRITKQEDSSEVFQIWLMAAATLMVPSAGRS